MRERFFLIIISFFLFSFSLSAQVEAPALSCVSGDSLYWDVPDNNCGPFSAYLIYASQNEAGPYTLLATITDPVQTVFYHEDPGVSTWYYYMESEYDCPGETVLQSDTLDSRMPEPPIFESVSVDGSNVIVRWTPSPSPEVIGYIISRNIAGQGTIALDTVFTGNTYTDVIAAPLQQSEVYFLEALDACGNRSLISNPHNTILMDGTTPFGCDRSIELSWNAYEGWLEGVGQYEIWVSKDDAPPVMVGAANGDETSYVFEETDNQITYCFTIRARPNDQDWHAISNEVCIFADVVQRQSYLIAANASVQDNGAVQLSWLWNDNASLKSYNILRSTDNVNFSSIDQFNTPFSQQPQETYTDVGASPSFGVVYYQIESLDGCDVTVSSNVASSIHLEANRQGSNVQLDWTPLMNSFVSIESYILYRVSGNGTEVVNTYTGDALSATDFLPPGIYDQLQVCYYLEAALNIEAPDGLNTTMQCNSSRACVSQDVNVYVPNAFSPNGDGRNDEFRPYIQFVNPSTYQLQIFDRWGGLRFESSDITKGWDGTTKGENAPTGLYLYYIYMQQDNGPVIERSGEISLLR